MEILIPGLLLVALMIWASTKIKRSAAQAFEREEVDHPDFSLTKPEGFLAPVDPAEGTEFSAHSREFGRDEADRVRQAAAEVRRFEGANFEEICERVKAESDTTVAEQIGIIAERKCANIVVERSDNGAAVETFYKIIAGETAVYQLSITVLPVNKDDFSPKIEELLASFALK